MLYCKAKMHQIRFRLWLDPPETALGELTALSQTLWLNLRGPTFDEK